jgi:hypothetical protein
MKKTELTRPELVKASADYFRSNPDVDTLLVIVGTGVFYRPERKTLAEHEAAVAETTVTTIHRMEAGVATVDQSNLVDVEGAEILPEFPAAVNTLELVLGSLKVSGVKPRDFAEVLYLSALQAGLTRAAAEDQLEAVADYLMAEMAKGLSSVVATPLASVKASPLDELLKGAMHLPGFLAEAPATTTTGFTATADFSGAQVETLAKLAKAGKVKKVADEKPAAAVKVVKPAKAAKAVTKKKATTPKTAE